MRFNKFSAATVLPIGLLFVLAAPSAQAQISKIGGTANLSFLTAPSDVRPGQHQSNTDVFVFAEKQNVSVTNLMTDLQGPVTGAVNSYLLYTDQMGTGGSTTYDITVSSDQRILGVITTSALLDTTDTTFGLGGTKYPFGDGSRGQENRDFTTLSGNTLTLHNVTSGNVDEIRVFTAAVPEPGSIALLVGMGVSGTAFLRRRKAIKTAA